VRHSTPSSRPPGRIPEGDGKTALEIAAHALAGEVALRREEPAPAVRHFRAAVDLEDRLTDRHPPAWYYPTRQSLGKALLAAGRPAEAERVYREDLARFPENGWSLFGLAQALQAQGRPQDAAAIGRRFRVVWWAADVALEASRF
jgi:tetratricopeptide (TPR) repeat protein